MTENARLKDLGIALHARLLAKEDDSVETEIADAFFPLLLGALKRGYANLPDPHLIESAAIDTMLEYFARPEKFDPSRSSLIAYLYMDARGNLLNALERERRLATLQAAAARHPAISAPQRNDPERRLIDESSPLIKQMRAALRDTVDQELLNLMMDGVRDTAAFAEVLGIQEIPVVEQTLLVKRHKDRLKASLLRRLKRPLIIFGLWAALRRRVRAAARKLSPAVAITVTILVLVTVSVYWSKTVKAPRGGSGLSLAAASPNNGLASHSLATPTNGRLVEKIFFSSDRARATGTLQRHIWMISPDGSGLEQVTVGDVGDAHPEVSADGTKLTFSRELSPRESGVGRAASIWVKDPLTGTETAITADTDYPSGPYTSCDPTWSPDGSRIAFVRQIAEHNDGPEKTPRLWIVDIVPSVGIPVRVTTERGFGWIQPSWSPDGKSLLCMRELSLDGPWTVYRIGVDSGQEEEVIPLVENEYAPRWSPDGAKLVWTSYRHSAHGGDIYIADVANPVQSQFRVTPHSGWGSAAWSPDGTQLVVVRSSITLTETSLTGLRGIGFPEEIVSRLRVLKDREFVRTDELETALSAELGEAPAARYSYKIIQYGRVQDDLRIASADGSSFVELTSGPDIDNEVCWARVIRSGNTPNRSDKPRT